MKIDLHIHTATGSDGTMTLEEALAEASRRKIEFLSITDHDAIHHQWRAIATAAQYGIRYITGVELNVTFVYNGRSISLDFLGYGYDPDNSALVDKLELVRERRENRGRQIMENLNAEFAREGLPPFTDEDMARMHEGVDGALGRPHIADYLIKKGIVRDRQEAFDRYLVKCDVPKYPLHPEEAAELVRNAGGRIMLAHPNDPNGTSLVHITKDLTEQTAIVEKDLLDSLDGIECWHSRAAAATSAHYIDFCKRHGLMMTGGSDCHQKPVLMGTVDVPDFVAEEFD